MSPIDVRRMALTGEDRTADRLADLERSQARVDRGDLNLVIRNRQHAAQAPEVTTTSTSVVDLGGPLIAVTVPVDAFVAVYAELDLKITGTQALVYLYEPTDLPAGQGIMDTASTSYVRKAIVPGSISGVTANTVAGQLVFRPTPGERTYSLRYAVVGATTGFFRARDLWVEVF